MSGSANIRRVEVGPIWNHADAKKKANAYLKRHPWVEWTGHWTTTVPNEMSVIEIRNRTSLTGFVRGENRDVEMGPIWNHQDAWSKAEAFVEEHPLLEWNGQWATTVISGRHTSVIGVRLKEQSQVWEGSMQGYRSCGCHTAGCFGTWKFKSEQHSRSF